MRSRRLGALERQVRKALELHPAVRAQVYIFGSFATGTFDGQSDVDMLVLTTSPAEVREVEGRLMPLADDVVVLSESAFRRSIAAGDPFLSRVDGEKRPLSEATEPE